MMRRVCSVHDPTKRYGSVTKWRGEGPVNGSAEMSGPARRKSVRENEGGYDLGQVVRRGFGPREVDTDRAVVGQVWV